MNFGDMMKPVAFGVGRKRDDDRAGVPKPMTLAVKNRRLAAVREASEVLAVMPQPGESLHAIMTGRYDLTDLLDAIFEKIGRVQEMRIATLSFNQHNVNQIQGWLAGETPTIQKIGVLCSLFFQDHNPETYAALQSVMASRLGSRLAASRNHCKVVTMAFESGERLSLEGSANLRTNSNREQFCLINDPVLHDWHAAWVDEQVGKHEIDARRNSATG